MVFEVMERFDADISVPGAPVSRVNLGLVNLGIQIIDNDGMMV